MGMSSNKNADINTNAFLLDPDSSEGKKTLGKGRRNVTVELQKGCSVIVNGVASPPN